MKQRQLSKIILGALLVLGIGYYVSVSHRQDPIIEYNAKRDKAFILDLFEANWYWLLTYSRDEYDPEFTLDNRSRTRNPKDFGTLTIKVLIENGEHVGFVAYFMETFVKGRILFLAVDEKFRGKGYGEKLFRFGCNELFKRDAKMIVLLTRTNNHPAQKLYKCVGFKVQSQDEMLVHFVLKPEDFVKGK